MKKTYIAILTAAAGLCSCIEMMDSASQADVVNPLNVSFKVKAVTGFVDADGNGTINTDSVSYTHLTVPSTRISRWMGSPSVSPISRRTPSSKR